jgi:hypothetical protein
MKITHWRDILVLALCALPGSGLAQTASDTTLPTNVPNIRTFVAPAPAFNPLTATPQELAVYGYPPRPDPIKTQAAYKAWAKAVSTPQTRLKFPQLKTTNIHN